MSASDSSRGKPEWTDRDRVNFDSVSSDIAFCVASGFDVKADDLAEYRRLHRKRSLWLGVEPMLDAEGNEA